MGERWEDSNKTCAGPWSTLACGKRKRWITDDDFFAKPVYDHERKRWVTDDDHTANDGKSVYHTTEFLRIDEETMRREYPLFNAKGYEVSDKDELFRERFKLNKFTRKWFFILVIAVSLGAVFRSWTKTCVEE